MVTASYFSNRNTRSVTGQQHDAGCDGDHREFASCRVAIEELSDDVCGNTKARGSGKSFLSAALVIRLRFI